MRNGSTWRWGAASGLFLLFLVGCSKPQVPPLLTEVYVWQQVRTDALERAVLRAAPQTDTFLFHAADVSFQNSGAKVSPFDVPWNVVAETQKPAGIVIRIPYADQGIGSSPKHLRTVGQLIFSLLKQARSAGISCREIQIDYDCPESKLGLYADFLSQLKAVCGDVPLAFTALPSWQKSPQFPLLARATGQYILQVHSLCLPGKNDAEAVICDTGKARSAIAAASRFGIPFRVALPTYGCTVLLDAKGQRVAVISEDAGYPAGDFHEVHGASNPMDLAHLVSELQNHRPPGLEGVIWYRLPVDTDRMNWSWPTFLSVIAGRQPISRIEALVVPNPEGFSSIEIRNTGEQSESPPTSLLVRWGEGDLESADALGSYRLEVFPGRRSCRFVLGVESIAGLAPGKFLVAGWIRGRNLSSLHVEIE